MKLSKVLGWAGKLAEADDLAQQAVSLFPNDARIRHQAGLTAHLSGRPAEAADHYRAAVTIQPDADEPRLNLGVILKESGDLVAAEHQLRIALDDALTEKSRRLAAANLAETLVGLGFIDYRAGRFDSAVARFAEADRLVPDNADTLSPPRGYPCRRPGDCPRPSSPSSRRSPRRPRTPTAGTSWRWPEPWSMTWPAPRRHGFVR
jgi:Flp pilus assembly protein TadD